MTRTLRLLFVALAWSFCTSARADEPVGPDEQVVEETVEVVEVASERSTWMGLRVGSVFTPYRQRGLVPPSNRVTSNQAGACLDPYAGRHCGALRGFDLRVEMFEARGRHAHPRWLVFFRTGYTAGRLFFEPEDSTEGFREGAPRMMAYQSVPLFFGGNLYLFEKFPVRPYGGLGFGFDVMRLQVRRHEANARLDASARIGFELHAGLEARITNYVSVSAEVMQLWSARRKLAGLPHYSNEGLTFIAGVSFAIPTEQSRRQTKVREVRRTRRVERPDAPPPAVQAPPHPLRVEVVQTQEVHTQTTGPSDVSAPVNVEPPDAAPSEVAHEPPAPVTLPGPQPTSPS